LPHGDSLVEEISPVRVKQWACAARSLDEHGSFRHEHEGIPQPTRSQAPTSNGGAWLLQELSHGKDR